MGNNCYNLYKPAAEERIERLFPMLRSLNLKITTILLLLMTIISACNLTSAPEEQLSLTEIPTTTPQPTRTVPPTGGIPTTLPLTAFVVPTLPSGQIPPTTIALPPTWVASAPTSTPVPISIVILSPIPGNVVAGNVQVLGAAIHPQFLQYQLEYGPDPNPGNLWYPATGIVQTPVLNGFLGIWNTTVVQDSIYQLRLRVTLRDGSSLSTVVNSIRIQNRVPTPVPSNTPTTPRPIAAFTQDRTSGQAPLVVRFTNQSSGSISSYSWSFGDGGTSPEINPVYTFRSPGVYNVTLTVAGPGGSSNVSRQINVQSQTPPVAGFTQDKTSGPSPLTVKFTNTSTGTITAYAWNFGDGQTSTEQNPTHQFTAVGTYNVILTVTGPGGSSSVTRKITVEDPVVPPPKAAFITDKTSGDAPLTVQFINQSTGQIQSYNWDFGDGETSADANPLHTFTKPGDYTVTLTVIGPGGQNTAQAAIKVTQKPDAPTAAFTQSATSGDVPLTIQFTDQSTGSITTHAWDFGDGNTSSEASPSHTFTTAGTYTVILTVTGPDGSDDAQVIISATQPAAAPVAAFTANPTSGDAPLTVQFTNQSSGQNLTHNWDFGDGQTSNEVNPSHTFTNPGNYTVRLSVSNEGGTNTAEAQISVNQPAAAPVAAFTANPTSGDAPLTVQFTNQSSGD
ncbi:MAG: PKD domain-containing protein, partial [Chloroflexi bacterium]|nr:PKD domain-containing protein [Chloroflexota bacterium]MDL1882775.1 PKD domain-containing protein [Anaerolineae bacterium CFX8]